MKKLMIALLALGAIAPFCVEGAGANVDVSFKPGAWNSNDWIVVKGPRWDYKHGFVQKADCIENECPDVPGDVVYKKYHSKVYSAMVHKERGVMGQTVSSTMGFDHRMAPLIVISEKLDKSPEGEPMFGEHWEIVLYDEGLNVWHHMIKDGKPFWYKAAYLKVPFKKDTPYKVEVKVSKTRKGVKEMVVKCGGYEMNCMGTDPADFVGCGCAATHDISVWRDPMFCVIMIR